MNAFNANFDIRTNIEIGKKIFEPIPNDVRPGWAGLILSHFDNLNNQIPCEIIELYSIIDKQDRWGEAHVQFNKIRRFLLDNKHYQPEAYLLLAENVAKVTYNSSNNPAPFDNDSGWHIPSLALKTAQYFDNDFIEEEIVSTITLFSRSKQLVTSLTAAQDFLHYKKIDNILWFDWDPIGINDRAPRDEYQSYTPQIFHLKKSGANRQEIAEVLLKLQTQTMGMPGTIEASLIIADKILEA